MQKKTDRVNAHPVFRVVFITLGIILVLLLLVNLGVILVLNQKSITDNIKAQVIKVIEANLDRQVDIGALAPDIFNHLVVQDVVIGPSRQPGIDENLKKNKEPFIRIEKVTIDYSLLKLLFCQGNYLKGLKSITLYQPAINLEYYGASNEWNFFDLMSSNDNSQAMTMPEGIPLYVKQGRVSFKGMPYMDKNQIYLGRTINAKAVVVTDNKVDISFQGEASLPVTGWDVAKWPSEWLPKNKSQTGFYQVDGKIMVDLKTAEWTGKVDTYGLDPAEFNYWIAPNIGLDFYNGKVDAKTELAYKNGYLAFQGEANLKGVTFRSHLVPETVEVLSGTVEYSDQGLESWSAAGQIDNSKFITKGYTAGGWFDPRLFAEVDFEKGKLNIAEGYLKADLYDRYYAISNNIASPMTNSFPKRYGENFNWLKDISLQGLFAGRFIVSGYLSQLSISGDININSANINHPDFPFPLTDVSGLVSYKDGTVEITSVTGKAETGFFNINGNIEDVIIKPYLNLALKIDKLALATINQKYPGLNANGTVSIKTDIGGFYDQPFAVFSLETSPGAVAGYNHEGMVLSGRLANGVVEIENLLAGFMGAKVAAKGALALPDSLQQLLFPQEKLRRESFLEIDALGLDPSVVFESVATLQEKIPLNLSTLKGKLNLSLLARVSDWNLAKAEVIGNVETPKLVYDNIKAANLKGGFYLRDGKIGLEGIQAELAPARVFLSGIVPLNETDKLNLNLNISSFEPNAFAALFPQFKDLGGRMDLVLRINGSLNNPLASGSLDWLNPAYKDIKFQRLSGKLNGDPKTEVINLINLNLTSLSGSTHVIHGFIKLKDKISGKLALSIRNQDLSEILEPLGYLDLAAGSFSAEATLEGTLDDPLVKLDLTTGPVNIMGVDMNNMVAAITYNKGLMLITHSKGEISSGSFSAFGSVDTYGQMDLQLNLKKLPLKDLPYPDEYKRYLTAGFASYSGRLTGNLTEPNIRGEAVIEDAVVLGQRIDRIGGLFSLADQCLLISNSEIKWGQGFFSTKGKYDFKTQVLNGELTALRADLSKIASIAGYKIPENIWANFNAQISGTKNDPHLQLDLTKATWMLKDIQPTLAAKIRYESGILQVSDANLAVNGSNVLLAGNYNKNGALNVTMQGGNIDLKNIKTAFDFKQNLDGKVNFKANLAGSIENFKGQLELEASNINYEQLQLKGLLGSFAIDNQGIRVTEFRASLEGNELSVTGTIPWPKEIEFVKNLLNNKQNGKELPLKLSVRSPKSNLSSLNGLIKGVTFNKGQLKVNVDVSGSWQKPEFNGYITLADASLNPASYPDAITDLKGEIIFSGNMAEINNVSAKIDQGSAKLGGIINLEPSNSNLSITYTLTKIPYKTELVKTVITGRGQITGTLNQPLISGHIELEDTDVNLAAYEGKPVQSYAKLPVKLDLNVDHKGDFRVRGLGLNAKGTGFVQITGSLANLGLDGRVEAKEGSINYLDNIFEITKAQLVFQRYRGIMPLISAEALTRLPESEVRVQINGTIGDLRTTLISDPPMSETEIIRKLTLHRFSNFAGGNIQQALTEELLRIVSNQLEATVLGDVENVMKETFKLDEFKLEPNIMERTMKFKAGKYLFENLYFTYSRTLEIKAKELMKLEYRIKPQTKLTASLDDKGEFRLGIEFGINF